MDPARWLSARLDAVRAWRDRRQAPRPRPPRRPVLEVPRARWWTSYLAARSAVRSGIELSEFLQHRLALRLGALPVPATELPVSFSVDAEGAIATTPSTAERAHPAWLDAFLRAEGSAALGPEIQLAQADVARFAPRIETQRERAAEATRELEAIACAAEVVDPGDEAQARQMGRPEVPLPLGIGLQLLGVALLLAETWQLAIPCLSAAGIRPDELVGELHRNPVGVVLGAVFALGATLTLFVLAHVALRRLAEALDGAPRPHRGWRAAAGAGAAALAAVSAWCAASLRAGAAGPRDPSFAQITMALLAVGIPVTTAWLVRASRRLEDERAAARAAAREWDVTHFRTLAEISRRAATAQEEEGRLASLEAGRAAAARRLQQLQARAATARRLAADAAQQEELELAQVAQGISAALELDRYEYVRQAKALGWVQAARVAPAPAPARPRTDAPGHNLGLAG